jgi:hypothetical protein
VPLAWSLLLALNTGVLIALGGDELEVLLLGGAAAAAALLAGVAAARGRARGGGSVPDLSPPAAMAGVAVAGLVLGAELGTWLVLISAGLLALGLGGLLRELRAAKAPRGGVDSSEVGP